MAKDLKSAPEEAKSVKSYKVIAGVVKHDGRRYRKDATVQLTEKEAAALLRYNVIEQAK
jgi:hypothetical protein